MYTVANLALILIFIVGWGVLCPLAIWALRRWAYFWNRPWLGSATVFAVTLALYSLWVLVWMWWARTTMPDVMTARAYMFGVTIGEGAALLVSAMIAYVSYRSLAARSRAAFLANSIEPN